mmetsp:Transcript_80659/g.202943  ORF Transcript_80659/g.202943 Transcript_80659/m.202943 type:complete len:470 (-) Transcript_80659:223-1632(-)
MVVSPDAVESEEVGAIEAYCKKHNVDGLVQELVEGLLRDRPETKPKEHFAHLLRMSLLKEQVGNDDCSEEMLEASKASEVPGRLLINLFEATKNITAEIVPKDTINIIIQETIKLLHADRVSLFVYDKRIDMLVLNASNLEQPIRVKPGQGIAGHVFKTQEIVNIPNCYEDERFDQTFDKQTGYRTNNLLTMPIVDFEGECMGVLQAINKKEFTHFSHVDEILLENLTQHVSIALRNAEVYRAAIVTSERASALLHMIQSLSQDLGVQSMILTVTMHANELVQADRCTVFLVDEKKQQLWSVSTDSGKEIRIPKSAGIAGECATEGKLIAIPDAYEDPRFNQEVDRRTGYRTKSILAIPVLRRIQQSNSRCLAVIQMINKMEFDGATGKFDDEDIQVMETFSTFVASKLEHSALLAPPAKCNESEASKAFDLDANNSQSRASVKNYEASHRGLAIQESMDEGDEEDCND